MIHEPGCRACEQITSGDCGWHGPITIPASAQPRAAEREASVGHLPLKSGDVEAPSPAGDSGRGNARPDAGILPLSPAEVAGLREIHQPNGPAESYLMRFLCTKCGAYWPCLPARLLATLGAAEAALTRYGRHDDECEQELCNLKIQGHETHDEPPCSCTCGLGSALGAAAGG